MAINHVDEANIARAFRDAQPFAHICIDGFLDHDFAQELAASYPSYDEALEIGRSFYTVNERHKTQICDPALFPRPIQHLSSLLSAPEFLEKLSSITGIGDLRPDPDYVGAGMHLMRTGGCLDVHVDFNKLQTSSLYRRLNLILYLNPTWESQWGGLTELWDPKVERCHESVVPTLSRCLLFETTNTSFHGVTQVQSPGITRNSFSAFYYTQEPRPGESAEFHSTIFKARPNERRKRYFSMPVEKLKRRMRQQLSSTKSRIKKIIK